MIVIDGTTGSLELVLTGAAATTELPFTTHWVDVRTSDQAVVGIGHTDGVSSGASAAKLATGPSSGRTRTIKYITVYNGDSTGATGTVRYNNGTTTRIMVRCPMAVGDTLQYDDTGFHAPSL